MKNKQIFSEATPPRHKGLFARFFALFFCLVMGMNVWGAEVKLIDNGSLNTTDFRTTVTSLTNEDYTVDGTSFTKCMYLSNTNSTMVGVYDNTKYIAYDSQTDATEVTIYLYNKNSSAKNFTYIVIPEGGTATQNQVSIAKKSGQKIVIPMTGRSSLYCSTASGDIRFCQIIANETGTTVVKSCKPGYSINFVNPRFALKDNSAKTGSFDGFEINSNTALKLMQGTDVTLYTANTQYIKFTLTETTKVKFTATFASGAAISFNNSKAYNSEENSFTAQGSVTLAAGTWYINPNGKKTQITKLEFEAVVNVPVTGVSLDKTTATIEVDANETLTATVAPANATNQTVTWSSDDEDVATVANGVVTAKAAGTAHITVKTADGDYTATCTVTVPTPVIKEHYAITYNPGANGTGSIASGDKTEDVAFTLSSERFTRDGYVQIGWATTDGGAKAYAVGGEYTANAAIELFPVWGHLVTDAPSLDVKGDVTIAGLEANGWYFTHAGSVTDAATEANTAAFFVDAGVAAPGDRNGIAIAKNTSAYAQYDLGEETTVTDVWATLIGGSSSAFNETIEYLDASKNVVKSYTNSLGAGNWAANDIHKTDIVDGVRYIRVKGASKWVILTTFAVKYVSNANFFTVTFDMQGATSAAIADQSVKEGGKAVEPAEPEKDGYNFVKWVVASTEADYNFNAAVTADVALKAVWEEITTSWTVTYNANGGTCGTASATWTGGDALVLPDASKDGMLFDGWYDAAVGGNKIASPYTPDADIELFAHYSYEKILRKAVFSNSFEAWIDESAKTATVYYLEGETAPTYVEGVASTGCTISMSDGKLIVKDADEATVEYVLTMTAVTPATVPVAKITPATAAEAEISWIKNNYGWASDKGWKFAKTGDDADWSRRSNGNNHIYLFVGACENVKLTWKVNRAVKVYRNGTEVTATTADGVLTIPGDIHNASMIKIASNQNSGDGGFSAVEVLAHVVGTDATLKDLQVNGETVDGFAAATETYDVELPFTASVVPSVTATATDANAKSVVVTDATELPGATTIVVTAEDNTTTKTYTINFTKATASSDATLSAINVAGEPIAAFDAATLAYTVEREYGDDVIPVVEGVKNHVAATVVPATSGNVVTLTVTAEDGTTVKAYTVTFTNKAAATDATLKSLKQGGVAIALVAEQYTYNVNLPYGTAVVPALTAEVNEAHATAVVTDAADFDAEGLATSTVVVTAQDGTTELTYTVNFAKELYPSVVIFDGATMSAVATSPDASGLAWSVTGFSSVANYSASCAGKDYTKTLPSGGNGSDSRYFEVVVPANHVARFYTVFGSHSSDSRSFSIGTTKARDIETSIYSATSPNRTTLIAGYSEWVEEGTYYIKPNASVDFYEVRVQLQAVDPKCEAPVITTQPETNKQFGAGAMTATVVASVEDGGALSYQWYNEADEAVAGATAATLSTEVEGKYYVVITNTLAAHRSNSTKSDVIELAHRVMNDATLSALTYGSPATAIALVADQYEYNVQLAKGTVDVPALDATTNSNYASKVINNAAAFVSYAATSTVVVTAEDGIATQTYTVNFIVNHDVDMQDVTKSTTWNWNNAGVTEIKLTAETTPAKYEEFLLANAENVVNNGDFESDKLLMYSEYLVRDSKYCQGHGLKFHTTVAGFITVKFSNTGNRSSEAESRYLTVNGEKTEFGSWKSGETVTTTPIFVPAGNVELGAVLNDAVSDIRIYNVTFTAADAEYTRDVVAGNYSGFCIDKAVAANMFAGAEFYTADCKTTSGSTVTSLTLRQVDHLEAGVGYICLATDSKIYVITNGEPAAAATEGTIIGAYERTLVPENQGMFVILSNKLYECGLNCHIKAGSAYINMNEVSETPSAAPGRRRVIGSTNQTDTATGMDGVSDNDNVNKMLINGQLFIIRGGKMFNAAGVLVK